MKFDRSKVVSPLGDNLEQWVGWGGFFSNNIANLKSCVEKEDEDFYWRCVKVKKNGEHPFFAFNEISFQWFYPVKPPKKKLVPFNTVKELLDWYANLEGVSWTVNQRPFIWIKSKETGNEYLIDGFIREPSLSEHSKTVIVCGHSYVLKTLLEDFTLLDGTPIGKEEQE